MRRISFALTFAVAGCSQLGSEGAYAKASELPPKFHLDCSAPMPAGNQLPEGTERGFNVAVDLTARKFSVPWHDGQWPLKEVKETEIVFIDEFVERGLDNNPMETMLKFDVPSGDLVYRSIASARMRLDRSFSASCKVVANA